MPAGPYLVLDRGNRRVVYEANSLEGARAFSEGRKKPSAIAMLAEAWGDSEWMYVFQLVNCETGEVLAESAPRDFDDAVDQMYGAKIVLVPACLRKGVRT